MKELIGIYIGTILLMFLSQAYYPPSSPADIRYSSRHYMLQKSDIFMVAVIAWLTCFSFLRRDYNDTYNYINFYRQAVSAKEFIAQGGLSDFAGNPLSYFYQSFMHDLTENYHIYFFLPAILSCFAVIKLFKRYSVSPALSLLIFFSIGTYLLYIAALKQCFAMFFLLMSIPYVIDRKYVKFYVLLFVAMLFHVHAFMFASVPFLLGNPWGKVTWVFWGATVFAMLTYNVTLGAFMKYAQSLGAMVIDEEVFDGHQIHILRVFVYLVPALLALIFRRRLFYNSTSAENLFVNLSIISAFILMIGTVEGANLYARMAGYFEIATAVALPWMINKLFTKRSAKMVTTIAVVLYFGYFCYEFTVSKPFDAMYSAITLWEFIISLFKGL